MGNNVTVPADQAAVGFIKLAYFDAFVKKIAGKTMVQVFFRP